MTCKNCDPALNEPGRCIKITSDLRCPSCGDRVSIVTNSTNHYIRVEENHHSWDSYFHSICIAVASKSPCLSRHIGAVIVKDKSIISTGYNGPSRGISHCGHERMMKDNYLNKEIINWPNLSKVDMLPHPSRWAKECPRRLLEYPSGEGMQWCPAQHAEENAISNAARLGVSVLGSTLYMNAVIPCQKCFGTLINAGVVEVVVEKLDVYDKHTQYLIDNSDIKLRSFNL